MFVLDKKQDGNYSLPTKEIGLDKLGVLGSKLAQKVLKKLAESPSYAKEIARALKENEQKIYYHINKLEKAGFIRLLKKKTVQGATANIYSIVEDSFVFKFKELKLSQKLESSKFKRNKYLEPFIVDGELNATIVVGSPDPHGPEKARSRDGYYGMDLALFLGTYLNYVPSLNVKLDTECRQEELEGNLIVFGGPVTNKITEKLNDKLPIRFENGNIKSTLSNLIYHNGEDALIVKIANPFNRNKSVLVIAGKRFSGTRAAIIAFLKHFNTIVEGNKYNNKINARVVEGIDFDSDGIVDDIEFLE